MSRQDRRQEQPDGPGPPPPGAHERARPPLGGSVDRRRLRGRLRRAAGGPGPHRCVRPCHRRRTRPGLEDRAEARGAARGPHPRSHARWPRRPRPPHPRVQRSAGRRGRHVCLSDQHEPPPPRWALAAEVRVGAVERALHAAAVRTGPLRRGARSDGAPHRRARVRGRSDPGPAGQRWKDRRRQHRRGRTIGRERSGDGGPRRSRRGRHRTPLVRDGVAGRDRRRRPRRDRHQRLLGLHEPVLRDAGRLRPRLADHGPVAHRPCGSDTRRADPATRARSVAVHPRGERA